MRSLVISDTHIGDPRCSNLSVVGILKETNYDRLILNGDFVDLWVANIEQVKKDPIFKLVVEISQTKEVIWIYGNHDRTIRLSKPVDTIKITNKLEFKEEGKRFLILHGHQVYSCKNLGWHSRICSQINCVFYNKTGIDFQHFFNIGAIYNWYIRGKRKKILQEYNDKADVIIIGHTHLIGCAKYKDCKLYDIGSAFHTKSYAIIENGEVKIGLIK